MLSRTTNPHVHLDREHPLRSDTLTQRTEVGNERISSKQELCCCVRLSCRDTPDKNERAHGVAGRDYPDRVVLSVCTMIS